jgi:hypothetical protein
MTKKTLITLISLGHMGGGVLLLKCNFQRKKEK